MVRTRWGRVTACGLGALGMAGGLAGCLNDSSSNEAFNVPNSVAIADLNGDGKLDIALAMTRDNGDSTNPGFTSIVLQNAGSPGTFQRGVHYNTGDNPSSIAIGDLAGTGEKNIVQSNFVAGTVSIFRPDIANPGRLQSALTVNTGGTPNDVALGDLNGDGKLDLVLADDGSDARVIVLLQNPATAFQFPTPTTLAAGNPVSGVAIGDINGDGLPDIAAANSDTSGNNGRIGIFYRDPGQPGSFLTRVDVAAGAQPIAVRIADLNNDGLADLAAANLGAGTNGIGSAGVSVVLQDAANPGSFLPPVTYATYSGTIHIAIGDLNADGKPDLVVSNLGPYPYGSVSVLLQSATVAGSFLPANSYAGYGQPLAVAIGDLNGDGRPDIAAADGDSASVMLQSATPGTFNNAVLVGG